MAKILQDVLPGILFFLVDFFLFHFATNFSWDICFVLAMFLSQLALIELRLKVKDKE